MPIRTDVLLLPVLALALAVPCLASEVAPEKPPEAAPVEEPIVPPQVIVKTQKAPDYPPAAKAARFDGTVHIRLTILPDGAVGQTEILECDHPNVGFEAATIEAAKQWKFLPARQNDQPIEYVTSFRINFRTGVGGGPGKVMIMAGSTDSAGDERKAGIVQPKAPLVAPTTGQKR